MPGSRGGGGGGGLTSPVAVDPLTFNGKVTFAQPIVPNVSVYGQSQVFAHMTSPAGDVGANTTVLGRTPAGASGSAITVGAALDRGLVFGAGTPEGAVTANKGSLFIRSDGGANTTLYVKESGTGNTGWVAK